MTFLGIWFKAYVTFRMLYATLSGISMTTINFICEANSRMPASEILACSLSVAVCVALALEVFKMFGGAYILFVSMKQPSVSTFGAVVVVISARCANTSTTPTFGDV